MVTRNTPPAYGLSGGPIIVACQWNMSSATGPVTFKPSSKNYIRSWDSSAIILEQYNFHHQSTELYLI